MFAKICGLSTPETVTAAVAAGADAIGFVFAPGSPRLTTPEVVRGLLPLADGVETVGVFRNQPIEEVLALARAAGIDTVQLHGSEPITDVTAVVEAGFGLLRAFSAEDFAALSTLDREFFSHHRVLLDAVEPGSGTTFDPALLEGARPDGFWLLAGGLTPTNVAALIDTFHPDGVDVSSGVESTRGVKSVELIEEFMRAVRGVAEANGFRQAQFPDDPQNG